MSKVSPAFGKRMMLNQSEFWGLRHWVLLCAVVLSVAAGSILPRSAGASEMSADEAMEVAMAAVLEAERARIEVVERVQGTVVSIFGNVRAGGGSGVLIDPAGFVVTNYHVVAAAGSSGLAGLADGELYRWNLVGLDPGGDLAMIKLEGRDRFPYARFGDSNQVRVGDWVMAMGNPFALAEDLQPTITLGIVSGVRRFQPGVGPLRQMLVYGNCIQIDSSINPGNSGGPLFNLKGQVVGINGRGSFEERGRVNVGLGYAISSEQVKNFIPDLMASRTTMHGTLEATFSRRGGDAVICESVNLDSPIGRAGLRPGDRLVSFDGIPIRTANQFASQITIYPANWPVEVVWARGDQTFRAVVRLTPLAFAPPPPAARPNPEGQPRLPPIRPGGGGGMAPPTSAPGEIRDTRIADREGRRVIQRWLNWRGPVERRANQLVMSADVNDDGRQIGGIRFSTVHRTATAETEFSNMPDRTARSLGELAEPIMPGLAFLLTQNPRDFKHARLMGGDLANGERAFRVHVTDHADRHWMLWISLLADDGLTLEPRLIKVSRASEDGIALGAAVTLGGYEQVGDTWWPTSLVIVRGDQEQVLFAFENVQFEMNRADVPAVAQVEPGAEVEPEEADVATVDSNEVIETTDENLFPVEEASE